METPIIPEATTQPEKEVVTKSEAVSADTKSKIIKVSRFSKFKSFAKTRKGKAVLASFFVAVIAIGVGVVYLLANKNTEPQLVIAENIASDKIYDNYDYIYNSGDNKLIASTADRVKQLEIISGEDKIIDYVISPDKKKIAYSLSDKDYKSKITSPNADITKFKFDPVAFRVYELNLETGENKLIWSTDKIELIKTEQRLYYTKKVVYPDSYVTEWYNQSNISYPVSYTYPVSYVEEVDDIERGYMTNYMPWDLSTDLYRKEIKLLTYNSEGSEILLTRENELYKYNSATSQYTKFKSSEPIVQGSNYYCPHNLYNVQWFADKISTEYGCNGAVSLKVFKVANENLEQILLDIDYGGQFTNLFLDNDYLIASSIGNPYQEDFENKIYKIDIKDKKRIDISNIKGTSVQSVASINSENKHILTIKYDEDGMAFYSLKKYQETDNTLVTVADLELPIDLNNFTYNESTNSLSFYRRYNSSTQTIIEYKMINLGTKEEKELISIKVDNDSVLNYKPKLIWFDRE